MIVNVHYYEEMAPDPKSHQVLFIAIWQPDTELYKSYPNGLLFKPMNEPNGAIVASVWNRLLVVTLPAIHSTNPTRNIFIGLADPTSLFFLRTINTLLSDSIIINHFSLRIKQQNGRGAARAV